MRMPNRCWCGANPIVRRSLRYLPHGVKTYFFVECEFHHGPPGGGMGYCSTKDAAVILWNKGQKDRKKRKVKNLSRSVKIIHSTLTGETFGEAGIAEECEKK